jgi:pimeloyl-ACP methyl ester carboxylesterase
MDTSSYFYDDNSVRYKLVKSNPGPIVYNWLFVPGGPGVDSNYFLSLIEELDVPGNFWFIDLPANGTNITEQITADYDFETWGDCLISAIQKFDNPIYVGHSFGGQFPLLHPQLEHILKGFVILNTTPSLWMEEAARYAAENNVSVSVEPIMEFERNPTPDTLKSALLACAPFYFPEESLEKGKKLFEKMSINHLAAGWWLKKVQELNYNAKWIPQNIPTLILGASHDCITPYTLFENDTRFHRPNILMKKVQNAGHFPWLEQMDVVKASFNDFENAILDSRQTENILHDTNYSAQA